MTKTLCAMAVAILALGAAHARAQQKEEITITTAVSNLAFSAVWVAEQLKYFEQEGVRAKVVVAGGGSQCQSAVVGRSAQYCASSSEGLILAYAEGAPLIAVQTHNRNMTLTVGVRKAIADKLKLTRKSPLAERMAVVNHLGTIGTTGPGAVSEQIFRFIANKVKADPSKLKFAALGGNELVPALMNNVIDGFAQSPPSVEITEAAGKGYALIPLGLGEIPEFTDYPFEVLMARPDYAEANRETTSAVSRAISRAGALYHSKPNEFKAALRAHKFSDKAKLEDDVFNLAYSMVAPAMPRWGNMTTDGWNKVINFAHGAGMLKDRSKIPTATEGLLWTNKFVGKAP
ncbi:MAG: ABC transporter substrate-binding protein [Deltaproteobacteria bacterium]|nr:ABC transporter substrate-binding protein [Deltaproteobacteria bacterium]